TGATTLNTINAPTISGSGLVCSSETYTVNQPTGSSVSWSTSNPSILTITSGGVASRVGYPSGLVNITATITSACDTFTVQRNNIYVGIPTNVYGLLDGQPVSYPQYCNTASRLAVFGSGIQTYNW